MPGHGRPHLRFAPAISGLAIAAFGVLTATTMSGRIASPVMVAVGFAAIGLTVWLSWSRQIEEDELPAEGRFLRMRDAYEQARAQWAGKERPCPKCGAAFTSDDDRGTCARCGHVFYASHPELGDTRWWEQVR
jgi:ribosomal protein S27AE